MFSIMNTLPWAEDPSRPNILYLTHRLPYPPDKGDRIRNFHLLKFLGARANLFLASLADEPVAMETLDALRPSCVQLAAIDQRPAGRILSACGSLVAGGSASVGAFASAALARTIRDWTGKTRFDFVVASASSLVPYLQMPALRATPAVIDLVDVDSQKWLDYADASAGPRAWLYRLEGRRLRAVERSLPAWAHAVTLVSEAEAAVYRSFRAPGRVEVAANGVDLDYFQPVEAETQTACVFVGALDYRPNVDAARWFCERVLPALRQRRPNAEAWLVGRQPSAEVRQLSRLPGVQVIGQVPDVRPYLAQAAVAVAPLRIARGLQNKVLEALAMGKAVVASPPALAALSVRPGTELVAATAPEEWVEALDGLLGDAVARRRLGNAGRRYVETNHHWERCLAPFAAMLGLDRETSAQPLEAIAS